MHDTVHASKFVGSGNVSMSQLGSQLRSCASSCSDSYRDNLASSYSAASHSPGRAAGAPPLRRSSSSGSFSGRSSGRSPSGRGGDDGGVETGRFAQAWEALAGEGSSTSVSTPPLRRSASFGSASSRLSSPSSPSPPRLSGRSRPASFSPLPSYRGGAVQSPAQHAAARTAAQAARSEGFAAAAAKCRAAAYRAAAAAAPSSPRRHAPPQDDSRHSPSPRSPYGGACSPRTDEGGRYYTGKGNSGGWATCSSPGRTTSGRWDAASPPSRALFPGGKLPAPALRRSASAEHLPPYYSNSSSPASSPARLRDHYVRDRFSPACSPASSPHLLRPAARGAWYEAEHLARV